MQRKSRPDDVIEELQERFAEDLELAGKLDEVLEYLTYLEKFVETVEVHLPRSLSELEDEMEPEEYIN